MQEDFIAWIWQNKLFHHQDLSCAQGEALEILSPGMRNYDSGPDYFNAKLKIDGMVWIGNVELHVKASDWLRHKHHYDPMYENVILHVVHDSDVVIYRKDGSRVPELILRNRYLPELMQQYLDLVQGSNTWVPCEKLLHDVEPLIWHNWLARVMTERLEQRCVQLEEMLKGANNDWEEAFYRKLCSAFGFRVNNEPFTMLAGSVPLQLLRKHALQPGYCEALLFGQSGLLHANLKDAYAKNLLNHYRHLQRLYGLTPLPGHIWKFGKLRPANFPTRRIAQLAVLIQKIPNLFNTLVHCDDFLQLEQLLKVEPDHYWKRHYQFDEEVPQFKGGLGEASIQSLIINAVIPVLFFYGRYHGLAHITDKALRWLEHCEAEDNTIVRGWNRIGMKTENALESQAVLFLKKEYCFLKKCVNCGIGQHLLQLK